MSNKVQIVGGGFQDAKGNILAGGKLHFKLSQDEVTTDGQNQIAGGIVVEVDLDNNGDVLGTNPSDDPTFIWPNDELLPVDSFYEVTAYTAGGQLAWATPQIQQVKTPVLPATKFDLDEWVPNHQVPLPPSFPGPPVFLTDGILNEDQNRLDLDSGDHITLTPTTLGRVRIDSFGFAERVETTYFTNSILAGAIESGVWTISTAFQLIKVSVNHPARIRFYSTTEARDADKLRSRFVPPTPGQQHGVLCDLYLTNGTGLTWNLAPPAIGFDDKDIPNGQIGYNITNLDTASRVIAATLTVFNEEP